MLTDKMVETLKVRPRVRPRVRPNIMPVIRLNDNLRVKCLYEHLISHPHPELEVKTFANKLRKEYCTEDFYSIITYTYHRLINERQVELATYIYDLFAYGEGTKYFYSTKKGRMMAGKLVEKPVIVGKVANAPVMSVKGKKVVVNMDEKAGKRKIVGKRKKVGWLVEEPVMAGKLVEEPVMSVKMDEMEVKMDEMAEKTDEIMEKVNFDKIVDYCLHHCVNSNDIKPIYDMLLELLYGVKDERWFEAKKKIHQRMVQMETKLHITVEKGGELYLEKNVEYEVKYVDAGGTGISVNGKNDTNNL